MKVINISGMDLFVEPVDQVINMGGPWIGEIGTLEDGLISEDCVLFNFIYDQQGQRIYFVKYHLTSFWRSGIFFSINFYDMTAKVVYEYDRQFDVVFIKQLLRGKKLEIYLSGHDQFPEKRQTFDLENEKYHEVIDYDL